MGKTTVFWIGIIAGPKAQGRHWKKLYLLHVGKHLLGCEKHVRPKDKNWKTSFFWIENYKPKGPRKAYLGETTPCAPVSTVGKSSTQIQVKAPGKNYSCFGM